MDEPQEGEERGKKKTMLAGKPDYLQKLKVPEEVSSKLCEKERGEKMVKHDVSKK